MIWMQKDSRTRWVRLSEAPVDGESVHAWFYERDRLQNQYSLRASYILDNYTKTNLTLKEMLAKQRRFAAIGTEGKAND